MPKFKNSVILIKKPLKREAFSMQKKYIDKNINLVYIPSILPLCCKLFKRVIEKL